MAVNFIEEIINADLESKKVDKITTRFPPEPNGYLHIGHAKSLCINFGIKEKYNGKCNLRFDDTNPTKEETEYVEAIKEDILWLGFNWDELLFASDFFEYLYEKAEVLIKKGLAYVCELNAEEMREYRGTLTEVGKESPYRNRSVEENLELFRKMRNGEFRDGEKTLRAKINMASPNINMRDPIIYRILRATHHRTKDAWCIYPMYDFTHPLCDAVEKISHSICTLEFEDHRPLYDWVVDNCDIEFKPHQYEFARLGLTQTIMSKRYLKRLVDEKTVQGWDDPRMPTLCGLRRRGYPADAIKEFCNRIGVSKANSMVDVSYLESCVRDNLNENAIRAMAVISPLKVKITNFSGSENCIVENHPNKEELGSRVVTFSNEIYIEREDFSLCPPPKFKRLTVGGIVRLKGAFIIKCNEAILDSCGEVTELLCEIVPNSKSGSDTSGVKPKAVIHFVDAKNNFPAKVMRYDYLLNKEQYDGQDFAERFNKDSKSEFDAYLEKSLENAKDGDKFQFIRLGYYVRDVKSNSFGEIVSLKDSK